MSWFNFNSKEREYSISVKTIAKEFGIDITVINTLLKNAGYNPMHLAFLSLTNKHLDVILVAYTQAVRSLYKEASKNFSGYNLNEQKELRDFFGRFVRKSFFKPDVAVLINDKILPASNGKIFKADLDNELISDYFFRRIRQLELELELVNCKFDYYKDIYELELITIREVAVDIPRPLFIYRIMKWRIKVKHTFTDIKSRIFTTIITGHYYIFSAEEDAAAAMLTSSKRCFLAVNKTLGEAFKNLNLKSNPTWKIIFNPL